jgi:hypothetical protein
MAQAKLNDYFSSKKRSDIAQSSKRRKLEIPFSGTEYKISTRTRSKSDDGKKSPATNPLISPELEEDSVLSASEIFFSTKVVSVAQTRANKSGKRLSVSYVNKSRAKNRDAGQKKLTDLMVRSSVKSADIKVDVESQHSEDFKEDIKADEQTIIVEEVTSFWDSHGGADQSTPRKRIINTVEVSSEEPHVSRKRKVPVRRLSPTKQQKAVSDSAKKKLVLLSSEDPGPSKVLVNLKVLV